VRIHLVTAVWGEAFTQLYLSTCLPNQMTSSNLPALAAGAAPVYKVYTRSQDAAVIAAAPAFRQLAAMIPTEVIALDHLFASSSHSDNALLTMTACHRAAVDAANHARAALMILPPDQIYSDGTFARCLEWGLRGCGAVVVPGIRLNKEGCEPLLSGRATNRSAVLGASGRSLLAWSMPRLSAIARAMFVDADPFSNAPTHVYFPVGDEGFVARCLHLHVLFINPRRRVPLRYGNFDTDYLLDACPSLEDYHVVGDSDEMLAVEFSPAGKQLGQAGAGRIDTRTLAAFYRLHGNRLHRGFLQAPIFMHTGDLTPRWREVARRSGDVVGRALPPWSRLMMRVRGS